MNAQKFTMKSLEAIQRAQALAVEYANPQIEQCHLLYALLEGQDGLNAQLFKQMGIQAGDVLSDAKREMERLPKVTGSGRDPEKVYITQDVDKALNEAEHQADHMKDEYVSVEHLMMGLISAPGPRIRDLFKKYDITLDRFLAFLQTVRGSARVTSDEPEDTYDALKKYGQELVELARQQQLDHTVFFIRSRCRKHSLLL